MTSRARPREVRVLTSPFACAAWASIRWLRRHATTSGCVCTHAGRAMSSALCRRSSALARRLTACSSRAASRSARMPRIAFVWTSFEALSRSKSSLARCWTQLKRGSVTTAWRMAASVWLFVFAAPRVPNALRKRRDRLLRSRPCVWAFSMTDWFSARFRKASTVMGMVAFLFILMFAAHPRGGYREGSSRLRAGGREVTACDGNPPGPAHSA